jgi:hypothetical protein
MFQKINIRPVTDRWLAVLGDGTTRGEYGT